MAEQAAVHPESGQELTFGQKAVGLTFNHGEGAVAQNIHQVKSMYADIIDKLNDLRNEATSTNAKRHYSVAITQAEDSQMRAIKAVTWKD